MAGLAPGSARDDAALAASIVEQAAALAAAERRAGLDTSQKTSVSDVVTNADHAAEALVEQLLSDGRPGDGLLGEEGASRPSATGRTWVVDPVDGTYNFAQGLDWWCSALALEVDGAPVLGAVRHDASGTTWVGGRDVPPTHTSYLPGRGHLVINQASVQGRSPHICTLCWMITFHHPLGD